MRRTTNIRFQVIRLLTGIIATLGMAACSADHVQKRQDKLTEHAIDRENKRQIRNEARQERTDAWFDRAMGKPVKTSEATGLRLPE